MRPLEDLNTEHDNYTSKASSISRQLGFAGLAIIWVFKTEAGKGYAVSDILFYAAFGIVFSLFLDFLQYIFGSVYSHLYYSMLEKQDKEEYTNPNWVMHILDGFLYLKMVFMVASYGLIIFYLYGIFSAPATSAHEIIPTSPSGVSSPLDPNCHYEVTR